MLGAVCPELELYVMEVPNFEERLEAKSKFCSKLATVSNFLKAMTRPLVRTNLHYQHHYPTYIVMHVLLVRDRRPMRPRGRTIRLRVVSGPTEPPAGLHTTVNALAWRGCRGRGTIYRQRAQLQDALTSTW